MWHPDFRGNDDRSMVWMQVNFGRFDTAEEITEGLELVGQTEVIFGRGIEASALTAAARHDSRGPSARLHEGMYTRNGLQTI